MRKKCKHCKHYVTEFSEWDYQDHTYCKLGIDEPDDIDECTHDIEEYTTKDFFEETAFGWFIVMCIVLIGLIFKFIGK